MRSPAPHAGCGEAPRASVRACRRQHPAGEVHAFVTSSPHARTPACRCRPAVAVWVDVSPFLLREQGGRQQVASALRRAPLGCKHAVARHLAKPRFLFRLEAVTKPQPHPVNVSNERNALRRWWAFQVVLAIGRLERCMNVSAEGTAQLALFDGALAPFRRQYNAWWHQRHARIRRRVDVGLRKPGSVPRWTPKSSH
jgi:hypothetical protein